MLRARRHLYASVSIAAGVNAHALCRYMGHSSIAVTFDLSATEASKHFAELLDALEHRGETFTVVRRGRVVATIAPARLGAEPGPTCAAFSPSFRPTIAGQMTCRTCVDSPAKPPPPIR